jgi:signal transduction histidine kinase
VALAILSTIRLIRQKSATKAGSLAGRLILSAAVWLAIGMGAGAYVLSHAFSSAVADNFDTALQVDLDGLIAAAEPTANGTVALDERYLNRRFARVYSGIYWQIVPEAKGGSVQISRSLFDHTLDVTDVNKIDHQDWGYADGPDGQKLRVLARRMSFSQGKRTVSYTFMVAGNLSRVETEIRDFNGTLARSFAVLGFGLILAILIQVKIGLMPLKRVGEGLARIRNGTARRLEGKFPAEIAPLAAELNSLIEHSAEVVGRARTHVSNLAHFFKTPLSVLASEADAAPGPLADAIKRQVEIMRRQVDHYLTRARTAGALDVLGNRTEVGPVLDALSRTLARIHRDRAVDIDVDCPAGLFFRGERQDFEEMAGNLMDNACKWSRTQVHVFVENSGNTFVLAVDDDGPGMKSADRERVLARGERLDESVPGSGLGLSIVRDIAKLYGGALSFGRSDLGGLAARLTLPQTG